VPASFDKRITPLGPRAVLFEDPDLVVVNKPAGLSVQSPERGDDLLARVALTLTAESGAPQYLSVHGYLDRDVSGAIALARRAGHNAVLAAQVRDGTMHVTWLAAVQGRIPQPEGKASTRLVRERDGTVRAAARKDRHAESVELRWRVQRTQGGRALLEASVSNGGARHLRAALAAVLGLTVAGDAPSGGPAATRLLLHAGALVLVHPVTRRHLSLPARPPVAFDVWLRGGPDAFPSSAEELEAALLEAAIARYPIRVSGEVTAYRLLHGEGEGLAGVDVDRLADHAVVWVGEQFDVSLREALLDAVQSLGPTGIYLKVRPKHASRIVDSRKPEVAPPRAVRGDDAPEELVVHEHGLKFLVRPGDGLSTGLFLDQRDNRRWLSRQSEGCAVLNLFAYTCSFTVAAAKGGARSTVSVDASQRVLQTGARNLELNGLATEQHALICDDVLRWLPLARKSGMQFERIVLDPPSFSTTHKSRFSFASDIVSVAEHCFGLLSRSGGILLVCTNNRSMTASKLRRSVQEAAARAHRTLGRLQWLPPQADFPAAPGAEPHMKALAAYVDPA
jgi:23S rRNA (cytosine1962-C5)-methyltransferase